MGHEGNGTVPVFSHVTTEKQVCLPLGANCNKWRAWKQANAYANAHMLFKMTLSFETLLCMYVCSAAWLLIGWLLHKVS